MEDVLTKQHIGNMAGSHERYDIYYFVDMFYPGFFSSMLYLGQFCLYSCLKQSN